MARRNYDAHIKSILHFDYPYYAEDGDGLADEAGLFTWEHHGAKLAGSEAPAEIIAAGVPKYGYRCLYGKDGYIVGEAARDIALNVFECGFWIRLASSTAKTFFSLNTGFANLSMNTDNTIKVSGTALTASSSSSPLELNKWQYVSFRLDNEQQSYAIYIDAHLQSTGTFTGRLPALSTIMLGGTDAYFDEFIIRDINTGGGIPLHVQQAVCSLQEFGGWGSGSKGNVTLTGTVTLNTSGLYSSTTSSTVFKLKTVKAGYFGTFAAGDEIMMINRDTGEYCFRTAAAYTSSKLTLNSPPSFVPGVNTVFVQVVNFKTLTIASGAVVKPSSVGVAAFRCTGDCKVDGSIITSGTGTKRTDYDLMRHSLLTEKFHYGEGGGIFIACGGTFTAGAAARLGASWPGNSGRGTAKEASNGSGGGAGYGGGGGSSVAGSLGGNGGVGGGGGACDYKGVTAGDAGQSGTTGGFGYSQTKKRYDGGTQGRDAGGNAPNNTNNQETGGGGAGGSGGNVSPSPRGGYCGASMILICSTLNADTAAISTGGEGGVRNGTSASGGGGTGFCYIACSKVL